MTVYADDIVDAASDIADAGTAVTFSRTTATYDPTTDTQTPTTSTSAASAIGVRSNWQKFAALGLTLNVPKTIKVAASLMAFAPQPNDTFVWAGFTYVVVNVETLDVDGTPILYTVVGNR